MKFTRNLKDFLGSLNWCSACSEGREGRGRIEPLGIEGGDRYCLTFPLPGGTSGSETETQFSQGPVREAPGKREIYPFCPESYLPEYPAVGSEPKGMEYCSGISRGLGIHVASFPSGDTHYGDATFPPYGQSTGVEGWAFSGYLCVLHKNISSAGFLSSTVQVAGYTTNFLPLNA